MIFVNYLIQFLVCMVATISFAIIFSAPKKELIFCGISGALGWVCYLIVLQFTDSHVLGNVVGTFVLSIFSRCFAVKRKNPAMLYLITGIFALVPGAGIYYTSYYLITDNMTKFSDYGLITIKTLASIVMGIIFAMCFPQKWFNKVFAPSDHK